jgi:predicted transport protein
MPIFSLRDAKLELISEVPFNLEMDIQRMVEKNMNTIFGLTFISSEFILNDLRIDSLAYDEESESFVIIEYKRDKNFSVIDQGLAYLATLLKNKADFILLYNQQTSKSLKKESVDWTQSKVIFIAPFYTTYQRKAIEFKDFPIELWEIKKYSNNTILFNQIQAPEKGESITKIGQSSEIVKSISKEIVTYSEEYHLERCDSRIKDVYKELKELILSLSPLVTIRVKKHYIAFVVRSRNFVAVEPRKSWLHMFLGLKKGELNDPKNITLGVPKTEGHYNVTHYSLRVNDKTDLGYLLTLIKQSYDKN